MAQKVNIILVDDLDGTEATETVTFGLDGVTYEIDLNDEHATELRGAVEKYVGHSRKISGRSTRRGASSSSSSSSGGDKGAIREWAKANGFEVSERGRIPANVEEAYAAAQKGGTEDKPKRTGAKRRTAEVSDDGKVKQDA